MADVSSVPDLAFLEAAVIKGPVAMSIKHGKYCGCTLLAAACGAPPDGVSYRYCLKGIQSRWQVTCRHGAIDGDGGPQKVLPALGKLDAVTAVLVSGL